MLTDKFFLSILGALFNPRTSWYRDAVGLLLNTKSIPFSVKFIMVTYSAKNSI